MDFYKGCILSIVLIVFSILFDLLVIEPYKKYERSLFVIYSSDDVYLDVSNDNNHIYQIYFYNDENDRYFNNATYFLGNEKKQAYTVLNNICNQIGDSENGIYTNKYKDTITWNKTTVFFKDAYSKQGWMNREELNDVCDALACYDFQQTKQLTIIKLSIFCGSLVLIFLIIISTKLGVLDRIKKEIMRRQGRLH